MTDPRVDALVPVDFIMSLRSFAKFCEAHSETGVDAADADILARKFYDAAFVIDQLIKLRDKQQAALAAADAAAPSPWRPIEEAPKDGTLVDIAAIYSFDGSYHRYRDCRWGRPGLTQDEKPGWYDAGGFLFTHGIVLTHFMLVPPLPQEGK